jgi:hypothetical protein
MSANVTLPFFLLLFCISSPGFSLFCTSVRAASCALTSSPTRFVPGSVAFPTVGRWSKNQSLTDRTFSHFLLPQLEKHTLADKQPQMKQPTADQIFGCRCSCCDCHCDQELATAKNHWSRGAVVTRNGINSPEFIATARNSNLLLKSSSILRFFFHLDKIRMSTPR